jgi:hypothetical protein
MASKYYKNLQREITAIGRTYLNFKPRPSGDYTRRQLSFAAAYTVFCHAEFENYFEQWASLFVSKSDDAWKNKKLDRQLLHLSTFHEGRSELTNIPSKDIWSDLILKCIIQHRGVIRGNHGIKESNICKLFAPLGFDVRKIDSILLGDLGAFGQMRGDYAHGSHRSFLGMAFDPFSRKQKAEGIVVALEDLDEVFTEFLKKPHLHLYN